MDASRKLRDYALDPQLSPYVWLRRLTVLKLAETHAHHLDVEKRDPRREIPLDVIDATHAGRTMVVTDYLAQSIVSPLSALCQAELVGKLQTTLEDLAPIDREILAMRHQEELSFGEAAQVLGLSKSGVGKRYLRVLERLHAELGDLASLTNS